ncbi:hypothetical protein [uncultured Erythrobacter sp.]|uniref:hypothetical protein n=1 Tax=uncultured Erythrobacter sp. TaxID=263913 RepID=UPI00262C240D|nr:hypothetical protein [uncultured Erythrobacter sp.]
MGKMAIDRSQSTLVDAILQDEIARGNRALRSLAPVIAHLLDSDGPSLVSDAIVARLRGMLRHIADQLLASLPLDAKNALIQSQAQSKLIDHLRGDESLVDHLYSVVLEGVLTKQVQQRVGVDPILSPLMQELIASERPEIAEVAMMALAAQSRFCQGQERMELPLGELPSQLLWRVLTHFEATELALHPEGVAGAVQTIKRDFDEAQSRIGLFARLASSMQGGAIAALDIGHAGLALFASATASLTRQEREHVVFACHEGQTFRLVLILIAAGLNINAIEGQLALLGGTRALPSGFETISQAHSQELLRTLTGPEGELS